MLQLIDVNGLVTFSDVDIDPAVAASAVNCGRCPPWVSPVPPNKKRLNELLEILSRDLPPIDALT